MSKSKKRKIIPSNSSPEVRVEEKHRDIQNNKGSASSDDQANTKNNPLYREQQLFLSSLQPQERNSYFSENVVTPERRAELWMDQAEIGEELVNKYAWATPTIHCLEIFRKFSPIVELGCGSNAYWSRFMKQAGGISVEAYDMNVKEGGKIVSGQGPKKKKAKTSSEGDSAVVRKGGPKVLKRPELQGHTLFLCYPDEEVDADADNQNEQFSFGWHCLDNYTGTYVIHVGELAVLGDATLNMEQSPWGRSSSSEFQQRLASEYHCIAKVQLPNWLHVRDSISVWKRSEICQMVFAADEDDEDDEDEIIEYRHIPPEEMLPTSVLAPCMEELLRSSLPVKPKNPVTKSGPVETANTEEKTDEKKKEKKETMTKIEQEGSEIPENQKELGSTKSKRGRRRERQKQKKMLSMQDFPSRSDDDDAKSQSKKAKKARSEYFRIHGKLPT